MEDEGHGFQPEAAQTAREDVLKFLKENIR